MRGAKRKAYFPARRSHHVAGGLRAAAVRRAGRGRDEAVLAIHDRYPAVLARESRAFESVRTVRAYYARDTCRLLDKTEVGELVGMAHVNKVIRSINNED